MKLCNLCNGSGEGLAPSSICPDCRGYGVTKPTDEPIVKRQPIVNAHGEITGYIDLIWSETLDEWVSMPSDDSD